MSNQGVTYKTNKIMPTWEQLAEMGRDIQFHPSTTEHPKVLTQEQLANFNRVGYIKGIPITEATVWSHTPLLYHRCPGIFSLGSGRCRREWKRSKRTLGQPTTSCC